jgi:hypothetical protein
MRERKDKVQRAVHSVITISLSLSLFEITPNDQFK